MKSTQFNEIEYKYSADHVSFPNFEKWAFGLNFNRGAKYAEGYDTYYRQGKNVVRHRYTNDGSFNQFTVKCRTSKTSIADRVEVDIDVAQQNTSIEARKFLQVSGFEEEFTIWKKAAIHHVRDEDTEITLVLYQIEVMSGIYARASWGGRTQWFMEIEVEKSPDVSAKHAMKVLGKWDKILKKKFKLKPALNKSLYEIYSGKKYKINKERA